MKTFHIGAQNDQLYIFFGVPPSPGNDHPNHAADRVVVAKVVDEHQANVMLELLRTQNKEPPYSPDQLAILRQAMNAPESTQWVQRPH
jgi:hypothetical protein